MFVTVFFRKIFETTSGSLKCARGSLSDAGVSGSSNAIHLLCLFFVAAFAGMQKQF